MNRQQKNRKDRRRFSRLMSLALSASMVLGSNVFAYGSPVMDPNAAAAVIAEQAAEETVIEQQAGFREENEIRGWEASVKSGVDLNRELRYGMSFNEVLDVLSNNVEIRSRIGTSGNETKLLAYGTDYVFDENSQVFSASQNAFKGFLSAGTPYTVQFKGAEGSGYTADAGFNPASVSVNFQLDKLIVSQNEQISVNLATKSFKYTGADQTPYPSSVSVNVGDFHLVANGRSEIEQLIAATNGISYRNNRNAGTDAAVEVRLNDNFNTTNGTVFGEAKFTITGISLSQNCTVTNTAAKKFQYNGAGQGPDKDSITITVGGRTLTAGADFDIVYLVRGSNGSYAEAPVQQGNKPRSRGEYFAKIVGKGNYAGSEISDGDEKGKDLYFEIIGGTAFKAEDLTIELPEQAYTGSSVNITTSLKVKDKFSGEELTYKQDGTGDYRIDHYEDGSMTKIDESDIIEPNYYYVVLEGTGAYQGDQVRVPFTVVKDSLANAIVNWSNSGLPYDGSPRLPYVLDIKLPNSKGGVLVPESDYTYEVDAEDFVDAGKYNITITGKNNYAGTQVVAEFSIAPRSIAAAEVTAEDVPARADNNAKRLSVVVRDPSLKTNKYAKELKLGKDYEYRDNGNGTVTIRGLYNYKDEQSVKINPANKMQLADSKIKATLTAGFLQYANKALEPKENEFTVVEEGTTQITLTPGTDYEITNWYNNNKAGTGIAVMQGKGNYVGEKQVEFEIRGIDLSANYMIMEDGLLREAAYNPAVSKDYADDIKENLSRRVVDAKTGSAGKTLILGADYKVEFLQNGERVREVRNAGVYTVVVKGKGQYSGELTYEFAIRGTDINTVLEASLNQNSFEYAGQAIEPEVTVKTKENKPLLKEGTDYEIVYADNNKVGKAYAIVRGLGAYEGTISLEFDITGDPSITPTPTPGDEKQTQDITTRYGNTLKRQLGLSMTQTVKGAKTSVTFTSSNPKVASIDKNGKITCKAVGTTVITTTAIESDEYQAVTKRVTLTVMPKKVGVKSIKSTKKRQAVVKSATTTAGNDGYQIQYTNNGVTKRVGVKTSKRSVTRTLTKLTSGKNVKVRIRAYKKVDGKTIFGPYCNWKSVKVK